MAFGISGTNNVTMENITRVTNITSGNPVELMVAVNNDVYQGWLFFILLWILGIILWRRAQLKEDQPLINAMRVTAVLTILSFILRAVVMVRFGIVQGLITDFQMWMFPLISVFLAGINKYISDN